MVERALPGLIRIQYIYDICRSADASIMQESQIFEEGYLSKKTFDLINHLQTVVNEGKFLILKNVFKASV